MGTAQWPQDVGGMVKAPPPMEEMMVVSSSTPSCSTRPLPPQMMERRARPQKEQALNCPRCNSTNTKFCYYNNYSLTQPRYFCKTCRRYWTEGGSLRNVPVGGGSRKNKRSSANANTNNSSQVLSSSASSKKLLPDLAPPPINNSGGGGATKLHHDGHDLNLAFPQLGVGVGGDFGAHHNHHQFHTINSSATGTCSSTASTAALATAGTLSAMELLRGGTGIPARGMSAFMSMAPMQLDAAGGGVMYPNGGFALQDFRSSGLGFQTVDDHGMRAGGGGNGAGGGYDHINSSNHMHEVQQDEGSGGNGTGGAAGRVFFPFEDLKQVAPSGGTGGFDHENRGQGGDSSGFWSGVMMGGAGAAAGGAPW